MHADQGALHAVRWTLLFAIKEFLVDNYLPPGWDPPVVYLIRDVASSACCQSPDRAFGTNVVASVLVVAENTHTHAQPTSSSVFVSTEKVLTCLKSHCYGNLMRR